MKFLPILLLSFVSAQAAEIPDCSGPDHWPANMALVNMKNAGILANDQVDLYRQVHLVTFERKDHKLLQAIVLSDASSEECSMGNAQVFVISQTLGTAPKAPY
jgi:hypothetical protein